MQRCTNLIAVLVSPQIWVYCHLVTGEGKALLFWGVVANFKLEYYNAFNIYILKIALVAKLSQFYVRMRWRNCHNCIPRNFMVLKTLNINSPWPQEWIWIWHVPEGIFLFKELLSWKLLYNLYWPSDDHKLIAFANKYSAIVIGIQLFQQLATLW